MEKPKGLRLYYIVLSEDVTLVGKNALHQSEKNLIVFQPFFRLKLTLPTHIYLAFNVGIEIPDPNKNKLRGHFIDPDGNEIGKGVNLNRILLQGDEYEDTESANTILGGNVSANSTEMPIDIPGEYSFVVKLNNELEIGRSSLIIENESDDYYE
ncbi:hypothetical protein BK129_19015 [Paenibacillus amylolyticus]|uniref:hypothetical protein n=1 Tax=Paenibacillus amylolyticus TaxID=1451 RepID=UPI00096E8659|nr:hypothetical protein [Paenibacillus amylolyticus]OMF04051.1 hypothetical protein BK129_19015 [Paenibacillus amylolyticus]